MKCLAGILFILSIPLLIMYLLQSKEKKNKLGLALGLIFMVVSVMLLFIK
jgi:hypothetical protein